MIFSNEVEKNSYDGQFMKDYNYLPTYVSIYKHFQSRKE